MTQPNGRVLLVLLNYKTAQMTADAMHCARIAMQGIEGEVLVVDNDSQDGSFEFLQSEVSKIDTADGMAQCLALQSGHNGGYGFGNNVGIRLALGDQTYEYVYILNSDAFPAPDAIHKLKEFMDATPSAGFAGSHLHGENHEPHFTQFRFPSLGSEFEGSANIGPITRLLKRYQVPLFDLSETDPVQVDWIAGASLLVRTQVFEDIGLFDENFFLYFEEVDLCRRARKAGWTTHYVPQSKVLHLGSVSTGMDDWQRIPGYWLDSRHYYFEKNFGKLYVAAATALNICGGSLARLRYWVGGPKPAAPPYFQTDLIRHFLRNIWRPARKPAQSPVAPQSVETSP